MNSIIEAQEDFRLAVEIELDKCEDSINYYYNNFDQIKIPYRSYPKPKGFYILDEYIPIEYNIKSKRKTIRSNTTILDLI